MEAMTLTASFDYPVLAGNVLIVKVWKKRRWWHLWRIPVAVSSVMDSHGNTYTEIKTGHWECINCVSGMDSVTAVYSSSRAIEMKIAEKQYPRR
jgi:hypothetical protein